MHGYLTWSGISVLGRLLEECGLLRSKDGRVRDVVHETCYEYSVVYAREVVSICLRRIVRFVKAMVHNRNKW